MAELDRRRRCPRAASAGWRLASRGFRRDACALVVTGAARSPLPLALTATGSSRTTSVAFLSARNPRNDGWRSAPSSLHSVNATSATSCGFTQCAPFASNPRGGLTNGGVGRSSLSSTGRSLRERRGRRIRCRPCPRSAAHHDRRRRAAARRSPSRAPCGSVKPPITISCRRLHLTLTQSRVRMPSR